MCLHLKYFYINISEEELFFCRELLMGPLLNRFSEVTRNDLDSNENRKPQSYLSYIFVFLIPLIYLIVSWSVNVIARTNSLGVFAWFFYIFLTLIYFLTSLWASKRFLRIADNIFKFKKELDLIDYWSYIFVFLIPFCFFSAPWFMLNSLRVFYSGQIAFYIYIFLALIHILICINASFRRIKDAGFSSLLFLPGLIPIIGQLYLLVLCCFPSKEIQMLSSTNEEESETKLLQDNL